METNLKTCKYHFEGNSHEIICECFSGKGGYYLLSWRYRVKSEHSKGPGVLYPVSTYLPVRTLILPPKTCRSSEKSLLCKLIILTISFLPPIAEDQGHFKPCYRGILGSHHALSWWSADFSMPFSFLSTTS